LTATLENKNFLFVLIKVQLGINILVKEILCDNILAVFTDLHYLEISGEQAKLIKI